MDTIGAETPRLDALRRRPERPADAGPLAILFREAQGAPLAGLEPALADLLLRQQQAGQAMSYRALHPAARTDIVEHDGAFAGRIIVERTASAVTIVDIALLAALRGRGFGTRLLAETMDEARAIGVPVRLRVMRHNAGAARLYTRLGFAVEDEREVDVGMVWYPSTAPSPAGGRRCRGEAVTDERALHLRANPASDPASRGPLFPPAGEGGVRRYPDRLRLPLAFDSAAMAAEVERLDRADWVAHYVPQNHDGDWSVVALRAPATAVHPILQIVSDPSCRDYAETPVLAACPALRATLAAFRCPLQAVRLMRLAPAARIKEHVDADLAFEQGHVRLHVPILTSPDVDFRLNGAPVALAAGSAWYLRLSDPHSVANHGTRARVHLVIDAEVNDWLAALFDAAMAEVA